MTLLGHAVSIADATGDIEPAVEARSWLARAHLQLGDPAAALAMTAVGRELTYPPEEPAMRLLEGLALLELNRPEESMRAFSDALIAADALLALADRNVAALQARALALSGLAVAAGDPARRPEAAEAFARAHAVTRARGRGRRHPPPARHHHRPRPVRPARLAGPGLASLTATVCGSES